MPGEGSDWDAGVYQRVSDPQVAWALPVIERAGIASHERVLDAGCGTGRVTALLAARAAEVIAVDASPAMCQRARTELASSAEVVCQDLVELELSRPVDVAFSTATFHWISDHDRLFRRLHAALRPGGRLVAQCGGAGNLEAFLARTRHVAARPPFAPYRLDLVRPWRFAGPNETERRLLEAGFVEPRAWIEPAPVTPPEPPSFVAAVCLRCHLDRLPESLHDRFVEEVLAGLDEPLLDYVRLNIEARRPVAETSGPAMR